MTDRSPGGQDNIRDKMRSIPFEVSAEIVGAKRHKSRNSLPPLLPVLDSAQTSKAVKSVRHQRATSRSSETCDCGPSGKSKALVALLLQVHFLKEGCGIDNLCRSKLKMEYALFYKQNSLDAYHPLPM